jgi:hypothetical protein
VETGQKASTYTCKAEPSDKIQEDSGQISPLETGQITSQRQSGQTKHSEESGRKAEIEKLGQIASPGQTGRTTTRQESGQILPAESGQQYLYIWQTGRMTIMENSGQVPPGGTGPIASLRHGVDNDHRGIRSHVPLQQLEVK